MKFKVEKRTIDTLNKCYAIAPMPDNSGFRFLVAAEKKDPCYLYNEQGKRLETIWTTPGGVMTMVQVPGQANQFLATQQFYSPNDSAEAKIVIATRVSENNWQVRTLAEAPFVHRFGILERRGINYLLVCCLKSGHEYKDDWSQPGKVFFAELPEYLSQYNEENQLKLILLKDEMGHNHGYSEFVDNGIKTAIVACDEGVYQFTPPDGRGNDWQIRHLYDQPVSEAVLCDFDGDGVAELGCFSPFHGNHLYICKQNAKGEYEEVWSYGKETGMLHASWACTLCGQPAWLVGWRKGERDLIVVFAENGEYHTERIDHDRGPANVMKYVDGYGKEIIVAANRETDEIAMYAVERA